MEMELLPRNRTRCKLPYVQATTQIGVPEPELKPRQTEATKQRLQDRATVIKQLLQNPVGQITELMLQDQVIAVQAEFPDRQTAVHTEAGPLVVQQEELPDLLEEAEAELVVQDK